MSLKVNVQKVQPSSDLRSRLTCKVCQLRDWQMIEMRAPTRLEAVRVCWSCASDLAEAFDGWTL
jgi:hypothetical protein